LAKSASDKSIKNNVPFSQSGQNGSYNIVYGYFLTICHKYKLKAAFTTSKEIVGPGR
jgi:hypothetical protein